MKKTIKKLKKAAAFEGKRYRNKDPRQCDKNIEQWLAQADRFPRTTRPEMLKYAALSLLADDKFEPFFKDRFDELSRSKLAKTAAQLEQGCAHTAHRSPTKRSAIHLLSHVMRNSAHLPRAEALIHPIADEIINDWQTHAKEALVSNVVLDERSLRTLAEDLKKATLISWTTHGSGLDREINLARQNAHSQRLVAEVQKLIDSGNKDFRHLLKVSQFALGNIPAAVHNGRASRRAQKFAFGTDQMDQSEAVALIKKTLNDHIVNAAEGFTETVNTPQQVLKHLQPLAKNEDYRFLNLYLNEQNKKAVEQVFEKRTSRLLQTFLADEQKAYKAIQALKDNDITTVAKAVTYEKQLRERYQSLLQRLEFSEFNQTRKSFRRKALGRSETVLLVHFGQQKLEADFSNALDQYVDPDDRNTELGQFLLAQQKKLQRIEGPFDGLLAGDYLNAIYQGDVAKVRRVDESYLRSLKPLLEETINITKKMSPLFELFSMGHMSQESINQRLDEGLENMTLIRYVAATYLFNYQTYSQRCLVDPIKFTVTKTTPDIVTENLLGHEVSRIYGSTSEASYQINREFEGVFRIIGDLEPEGFYASFLDHTRNDGKMQSLFSGTKAMMRNNSCDSDVIKRMEKNLRTLFYQMN